MPEHELINPLEQENWNNLLLSSPGYSFFHTSNWGEVLRKSYGYQPFYLLKKNNDVIESLMPIMQVSSAITGRRGVSLPFSDYCPLTASDTNDFQNLFHEAITFGKKKKWKYLELRGGEEYLIHEKPSATFWGHAMDLSSGIEKLYSQLRNSTRRNIQKAISENVEVRISTSLDSIKEFYLLNVMTRKEHGLPPQPYRFFQNLHQQIIDKNMGFLSTASIAGHTIATNVYLHFGDKVIYKYGASDKKYQHLRANNLIMWKAIQWCYDQGFQEMTLGRTELEHKGLLQFKDGWGTKTYQIVYYRYDMIENRFVGNSDGVQPVLKNLFSKLPQPVLKIMGHFLYRHMG